MHSKKLRLAICLIAVAAGLTHLIIVTVGCSPCEGLVIKLKDSQGQTITELSQYTVSYSRHGTTYEGCTTGYNCNDFEGGCTGGPETGLYLIRIDHADGRSWQDEVLVPDDTTCQGYRTTIGLDDTKLR
jgi:hypothetical protein